MTLSARDLREYFASHTSWLWNWQDQGEVVTWASGETIAFRPEIEAVLARLEPTGLPPFGAIVLLIAACRNNWSSEGLGLLAERDLIHRFPEERPFIPPVFRELDGIHRLRHRIHQAPAMAELAALVFERNSGTRVFRLSSLLALQAFRKGLAPQHVASFEASEHPRRIIDELRVLRQANLAIDENTLQRRLSTGLDSTVEPAPGELAIPPAGALARKLIQQLEDDEQLGGVARLARLLLAAVQLPRPLSDPEDLPVGGVTDITNRGPLDRLVLSELAHDDLTLAVRVAMNEALYLRREPLAGPPIRQRCVLLDAGLRMWGLPRVFATAVGLAVAAQAGPRLEVQAWRANHDRIVPVDFSSAQGLEHHLAALDHRVHPGSALEEFASEVHASNSAADALLITADDVWTDRDFRLAIAQAGLDSLYVALVNRDGGLRLLQRTAGGAKVLREACFELQDVLKPPPKVAPLVDRKADSDLPALCRLQPFPLLLSYPVRAQNTWESAGFITLTSDRRLLHWETTVRGARQIAEGLPPGQLHWCDDDVKDDTLTVVFGRLSQHGLYCLRYNLDTGERNLRKLDLPADQPLHVQGHNGVLLVTFRDQIAAVDPSTGLLLDRHLSDRPLLGRMFARSVPARRDSSAFTFEFSAGQPLPREPVTKCGHDDWFAFSFDGRKLVTVKVYPSAPTHPPLVTIVDRRGGPVGLTALGELVFTGDDSRKKISYVETPCRMLGVSRDGSRIAVAESPAEQSDQSFVVADIDSGTATRCDRVAVLEALERSWLAAVPTRVVRSRFMGITVDDQQRLTLVSPRGHYSPLVFEQGRELVLRHQPDTHKPRREALRFQSLQTERERGYSLAEARWPDGSRAVLDSRGLLHLRSAQSNIPECSIVLAVGATAGWTSDGQMWGPAYFTDQDEDRDAAAIYPRIVQPFIDRLT